MSEINECYSKLMEYVYCIDKCLSLSANNKKIARLADYKKPEINEMDTRILFSVCKDLSPLTLEGKCLLECTNSKIIRYGFKKPEDVKDENFIGTPVKYAGNMYIVRQVCLYNQKWLKEYYNDPYELLSKAGTDKTSQQQLLNKQKLKNERRQTKRGTVAKPIVPLIKINIPKNSSNPSSKASTPAFIKRGKKNGNKESTPNRMKEEEDKEKEKQQQQQKVTPNTTPNSTPLILPRKTVIEQNQNQNPSTSVVQMDRRGIPVTVTRTPIQQQQQQLHHQQQQQQQFQPQLPPVVITPTKQYTQQPPPTATNQQQCNINVDINNIRILTTAEPIVTPTSTTRKYNNNNNNNKENPKSNLIIEIKEPPKKETFVWCCCEESKTATCCYDLARNLLTFSLLLVFIAILTLKFAKYMNYSSSLLQKFAIIAMFCMLGIVIEILEICINCCKIQSLHYIGYRLYSGVICLYYILIAIYTMICDSSLPYMCFFCMAFVHLFGICWKKPSQKQ